MIDASAPTAAKADPFLASLLLEASAAHRAGDLDLAEQGYRQALGIVPDDPNALQLLGLILGSKGRLSAGRSLIERAIRKTPGCAFFHSNLGNLLQRDGKIMAAIEAYRQAIRLDPEVADAHANLAGALTAASLFVGAEISAERALSIAPYHPIALANLAGALIGQLRFDDAAKPLDAARRLAPQLPEVWLNTGHQRMAEADFIDAEASFRKALELAPLLLEAKKGLAFALARRSMLDEARQLLEAYVQASDQPSNAHSMLGHIFMLAGNQETGLPLLRTGIGRTGVPPHEHSTYLFDLNYCPDLDPATVLHEHRQWSDRYRLESPAPEPRCEPLPDRRLRVGFVSPDFRAHSVSFFLKPLLQALDPQRIEVVCYSSVRDADRITLAFRQIASEWQEIWGIGDADVAQMVRDDAIDVLIDLAGHSADNRLGVFRYRPAPLQLSYLGYPNTTGMDAIDARLVDRWTDPAGAESHASERLLRLDRCFLAYRPEIYPAIAEPPCLENGFISFGSFNNIAKINDHVLSVWASILQSVPASRLILKHDASADPMIRKRIESVCSENGVDSSRISLLDRAPDLITHLECYRQIDIALDSFPYNGTTTTCEALWMGVPVVTLTGKVHAGRVGTSLLTAIGFDAGIATDVGDYCQTAITLAANPPMLRTIRHLLRDSMSHSSLFDADGLAREFESELRELWQVWCAGRTEGQLS